MRLALKSLTLSLDAASGTPGVSGALGVLLDDGTSVGVPDFAMGMAAEVPLEVKDALRDVVVVQDGGLWFHTDPARSDQRWFVQLRDRDVTLVCEATAGTLGSGPLTFGSLLLRVLVESRIGRAPHTRLWLSGAVDFTDDLGPIRLRGLHGEAAIDFDVGPLSNGDRVLAAPSTVLDGGFTGTLTVRVSAAQLAVMPGVELPERCLCLLGR